MAKVVNLYKEPYTVYIGRGSKWGNPYRIGKDGDRSDVISKYRALLYREIRDARITIDELLALKGETLGCFCKPKPCHGDVIVETIDLIEMNQLKKILDHE